MQAYTNGAAMEDPRLEGGRRGFRRRPTLLGYIGAGGLEEDEAQEKARELVRRAREESAHYPEGPAPDPDQVRERREAHHRAR